MRQTSPFLCSEGQCSPYFKYYIKVEISVPLTWIWCATIADNLSQQDTKGPGIRFDGERTIINGLRGSPFDGESGPWVWWKIVVKILTAILTLILKQATHKSLSSPFPCYFCH